MPKMIQMREQLIATIEAASRELLSAQSCAKKGKMFRAATKLSWASSYIAEANKIVVSNLTNNGATDA